MLLLGLVHPDDIHVIFATSCLQPLSCGHDVVRCDRMGSLAHERTLPNPIVDQQPVVYYHVVDIDE